MDTKGKTIQSLERGFMILETLSFAESPLSLQDITQSVRLAKTTVYGLLATLVKLGYVERTKQTYQLGLRLRELSKPLEQRDELVRRHFYPLLKKMALLSNNTAYLAIQSGADEYLYIDAIEKDNPLTIRSPRGRRESLIDSAIGKIFVSFNPQLKRILRMQGALTPWLEMEIEQISQQGFSLDLEQAEPGLHCLAIPLYMNGDLVAAAGLSGAADELTEAKLRHFAQVFLR
ncbi:IclR family transcriptional regulator [Vibrio parahaemolyticus]|nr:IclR family transcriptional regulator [Vibrio parahaemolyticus]